jgi:hypothetical protein
MLSSSLKIIVCFIFLSVYLPAQNKIKIKKQNVENDCCTSLILRTLYIPKNDTINYDTLIKAPIISFGTSFIGCENNVNSIIHSMELRVNNNKNKTVIKGNVIDFRNYLELKKGGIITIENIKVTCTNQYNESNEIIIKPKKYIVLPSEE